jgi:hypothetical protein
VNGTLAISTPRRPVAGYQRSIIANGQGALPRPFRVRLELRAQIDGGARALAFAILTAAGSSEVIGRPRLG